MARCWQVVTQREMFPGGTARATNPPRLRRLDGINHHEETNGILMRRCCRIRILCLKRCPRPVGHASALKGLKPSAQAGALGTKGISNSRPERAKALLLKAFAPSGRRMMCARINPGRCPGLGARCPFGAFLSGMNFVHPKLNATIVESNATKIESNATTVESNAKKIESNATTVESNAKKIESNATAVESNATIATSNACLCSAARLF